MGDADRWLDSENDLLRFAEVNAEKFTDAVAVVGNIIDLYCVELVLQDLAEWRDDEREVVPTDLGLH